MGVRVTVGGNDYHVEVYSVSEEATPLDVGDSMGSVGEFGFELPFPDRDLYPSHPLNLYGAEWLIGQDVELLSDSNYGFTLGSVTSVSPSPGGISVSCISELGELNVYNIQAQPFIGTLGQAFEYYLSLVSITTNFAVDDTIASRNVVLPGFSGELWYHLKQLAAAQDCDISLVSGVILLRPVRVRVAQRGRTLQQNGNTGGGPLARAVEVYWYDSRAITDELVYPVGGWEPDTEVLNVNAGETAEYTLELSASLSSIQTPVMQTFVASEYDSSSVYTVVADDGFPVPVDQWALAGGSVEVTLNPGTSSLTVKLTGGEGIPVVTGGFSKTFSLALASDVSGSRYSTLRIVGTGVAYSKDKKRVRTGVSESATATDVGVTIDNPFITDLDSLYRAGTRAAKAYCGINPSFSATVSTVTPRGDTGEPEVLSYGAVEDNLESELGPGFSYSDTQTWYGTLPAGTYLEVNSYWMSQTSDNFTNQTFGNVQGARIWDPLRKRWFRVRSATTSPESISVGVADDDLTHGDVYDYFTSLALTYGDVDTDRSGLTYQQERMVGLRVS